VGGTRVTLPLWTRLSILAANCKMHCLYGPMQQLKLKFELKAGTSLSEEYGIIHLGSEWGAVRPKFSIARLISGL
jgi:hypothetical protein